MAEHYDLVIIGTGSGNSILSAEFDHLRVAICERDVFGGTCLNRGCIPSKMFIYAADVAETIRGSSRYGIDATLDQVHWSDIVDRVFGRIDPIAESGERYRAEECRNVTVYRGDAVFIGERALSVAGHQLTADQIVVAAGARPFIPDIEGLADVDYDTSDTIMRIRTVPDHLIVVGGGFIGVELAHVFGGMGADVTIVHRRDHLLRVEDDEIARRFTAAYRTRFDLRTGADVQRVEPRSGGVWMELGDDSTVEGDALLIAAGRTPNGDLLALDRAGVELRPDGRIAVDENLATTAPGVWALGDVASPHQLKHVANHEARVVAHNVLHPGDLHTVDHFAVPHAVFALPQVAAVGMTEREVIAAGLPYTATVRPYGDTAYGWAMEDTVSVCKLIAHSQDRRLLGAHLMGPQASTLIQQLIQGMRFGLTVDEMASGQMYIHPALTEVVEQALLDL